MAEHIDIPAEGGKKELYEALIPQIESVVGGEKNIVANMANVTAMLKEVLGFFWVGFYVAEDENTLVLGPFQGTLACTRIKKGRGVCGSVFGNGKSLLVSDVEEFPGHIACSSLSKSEVVVPIVKDDRVIGVLDVDSDELNAFDDVDKEYLEKIALVVSKLF
ncbi:MAG: GAF domain-containing protein [Rikenellaceae bacterium]